MRGKTIRQFLIDGIPDGRWVKRAVQLDRKSI